MPLPEGPDASRERIVAAATTLFAEHGYDGTTTRGIAAAAGLNMATVAYHVGGKPDLYQEVMRRAHQAEQDALGPALADFRSAARTDAPAAAAALVDRYLDFCLAQPHVPALWMRRWLADAAEVADLEAAYASPLIESVRDAVLAALPDRSAADVEMTVWTVLWSTHGFCRSGILDAAAVRRGPGDPASVARFRAHLRGLVLHDLGLVPTERQR
ncbi:TetR/AcrR family transcriptional regulator [Streptacidiphilus cavernicola]|uniref:TetR/AcrR family transcriptional regulator n=1 Tax=Streptacidiphilus cavernicola TaxID=3342716 RepID=A0ABV6VUU8_9ACTN